jgi:hypothetical protein
MLPQAGRHRRRLCNCEGWRCHRKRKSCDDGRSRRRRCRSAPGRDALAAWSIQSCRDPLIDLAQPAFVGSYITRTARRTRLGAIDDHKCGKIFADFAQTVAIDVPRSLGCVTGRPALGLRKRTGQVEEFDLFFTHSLKLHLIRPKTDNNKINDIWVFGCAEND